MRSPGHLAVAMAWSLPVWLSIALGDLADLTGVRFDVFLPRVVPRGGVSGRRRLVADPGRRRRLPLGLSAVGHAVLRRQSEPSADGGHRAARSCRSCPSRSSGLIFMWQDGLTLGGLQPDEVEPSRRRDSEVSVLRAPGRQGRRLAREQGGRGHSPAPRVPRVRPPLHELRADRRDSVHGRQEGRPARAIRAAEARGGPAQGLREAAGAGRRARGDRRQGRGHAAGEARARDHAPRTSAPT